MNFSIKHNPLAIQILSASIAACTIIVATMEQANLFPQEEWISHDQLPQLQQLIPKMWEATFIHPNSSQYHSNSDSFV